MESEQEEFFSKVGTKIPATKQSFPFPTSTRRTIPSGFDGDDSDDDEPRGNSELNNFNKIHQWSLNSDGDVFTMSGKTCHELPSGLYKINSDESANLYFCQMKMLTDELIKLPDTDGEKVIKSIQSFWSSKEKFKAKGQLFKRGVLLWGPPGSGKTVTIMQLIEDLISRNGIVIFCQHPHITSRGFELIRKIEPKRSIINVIEDIDELIEHYGESSFLSMLDGENQIDNIVHIATTNYPEKLDPRIINRPSRFDEIIKVNMPTKKSREIYLRSKISEIELDDKTLMEWVNDTEGFSIAHLRELVVSVFCLDNDYPKTLNRLQSMQKHVSSLDSKKMGFA
jgi:predicted ATPase